MRVLVTGHDGYIGGVLVPIFQAAGHEVVGLDTFFYEGCDFGGQRAEIPALRLDLREVEPRHLEGFDAVVHLAALSNDPLGDLDSNLTYDINHLASVRLARAAKAAGVPRFLFSSSCSLYGAASPEECLTEEADFNPVTAYGISKVRVEQDVARLADADFSPIFLRNATAYGVSPRLRGDLVVNNLVGYAVATGAVLIKSDGTPWRPLVHIRDISNAFLAILHAPRERVHNEAFNIGLTSENYQIRDVASMVEEIVPNCRVAYAEGAGPDLRCYRVDFGKVARVLPELEFAWTVRRGIEELYETYRRVGITVEELQGRYSRIRCIRDLLDEGRLEPGLRWQSVAAGAR
jgi:nucleoside-diphosphate-sugar epimerase